MGIGENLFILVLFTEKLQADLNVINRLDY